MCPPELALKISLQSDRNLRRALLMLEAAKMQMNPSQQSQMLVDQPIPLPDWELFVQRLAREILQEQSPSKLLQARDMLYELLTNCIPADVIMTTLTRELMKSLDDTLKHEVAYWAAYYEHRIVQGSKEIFHLEAFVAKFMAIYKKFIISLFG
jgi:replication factor C subunit 3/5